MRLGGEVDDRIAALQGPGDGLRVLDGAMDEGEARVVAQVLEILLAPGVGELVEHDDLVTVIAQAQPGEVRADEPGTAADEQLHAATSARSAR